MAFKITLKKVPILLLVLAVAGAAAYLIYDSLKVVPTDLLQEAMEKTFRAESYSFGVQSTLLVDGKERPLSDIKGKKDAHNNYYLSGTMLRQKVEVYQIQNTTYFREGSSDKWMVMKNNNIMTMQQFTTEVNPLSNFSFAVPEQVKFVGKEEVDGRKCYVLECSPNVENEIMVRNWKNFSYKMWVDRGKKVITKAAVTAENKENPKSGLELQVTLKEFNKVNPISSPGVSEE